MKVAKLRWLAAPSASVIVLATLAQAHLAIGSQGVPVLGVFMQREFGLTRTELGLFSAVAQTGAFASMLFSGWLADAFGVRRTLAVGLAVIGLAVLGLLSVNSFLMVLPFVLLSGSGNGIANPAVSLAILHWLPFRVHGMAMSLKQTGVPLAGVVMAAGLTPLAEAYGWRAAALVAGAAVLLMALAWALVYRDTPVRTANVRRPTARATWSLLRNPAIFSMGIFAAVGVAAQFSLLSHLMLFLYQDRSHSLVAAGQILAAAQVGGLLGRIWWGLASDRLLRGARKPAFLAAGSLGAIALVAVALLPMQIPALALVTAFALGLTLLAWHGLHPVAVAEAVGTEKAGQAIGLSLAMNQIGAISGPPLVGLLVDRTGSYELAWLLLAGALCAAVVLMAVAWHERSARV